MPRNTPRLESANQADIIKFLEDCGWYVIKLIQTNKNGITDLLAIRSGRYIWIEVKRQGMVAKALQVFRHIELRAQGAEVRTDIYSIEQIKDLAA